MSAVAVAPKPVQAGSPIVRPRLFTKIRPLFGGAMQQPQVDGLNRILDYADEDATRYGSDMRKLAYMLATTFHETGARMVPVREQGSEAYLQAKPYYPWVGEGLVQVTWDYNAHKFGATKPGDCMSWPIALRALFAGMMQGTFTTRSLPQYFSTTINDPLNARRIINGTDKADVIAGYYRAWLGALTA